MRVFVLSVTVWLAATSVGFAVGEEQESSSAQPGVHAVLVERINALQHDVENLAAQRLISIDTETKILEILRTCRANLSELEYQLRHDIDASRQVSEDDVQAVVERTNARFKAIEQQLNQGSENHDKLCRDLEAAANQHQVDLQRLSEQHAQQLRAIESKFAELFETKFQVVSQQLAELKTATNNLGNLLDANRQENGRLLEQTRHDIHELVRNEILRLKKTVEDEFSGVNGNLDALAKSIEKLERADTVRTNDEIDALKKLDPRPIVSWQTINQQAQHVQLQTSETLRLWGLR